jgi:Asp-tRNA(Asn)/Glu-tRNA(Gln) amidotransferase B subunit
MKASDKRRSTLRLRKAVASIAASPRYFAYYANYSQGLNADLALYLICDLCKYAGMNKIREFRKAAAMTQEQLAQLLGIDTAQISRLERGTASLTVDRLRQIARALDTTPAALVDDAEGIPAPNAVAVAMEGASAKRMREDLPVFGTALGAPRIVEGEAIEQTTLNSGDIDIVELERRVRPLDLARLLDLVRAGTISNTAGRSVFAAMLASGDPPEKIVEAQGLTQVNDDVAIDGWISEALADHPAEAARFLGGERRLQGVFVGHVIKKSKGRADPKRVNQLLAARASG